MRPASTASVAWITHVLVRVERGVAEAPAGDERHDELDDEVSRAGARGRERDQGALLLPDVAAPRVRDGVLAYAPEADDVVEEDGVEVRRVSVRPERMPPQRGRGLDALELLSLFLFAFLTLVHHTTIRGAVVWSLVPQLLLEVSADRLRDLRRILIVRARASGL